MIDAMSTPQIEETAEYLAWLEAAVIRAVLNQWTIDEVNAMLSEAAHEHQEG